MADRTENKNPEKPDDGQDVSACHGSGARPTTGKEDQTDDSLLASSDAKSPALTAKSLALGLGMLLLWVMLVAWSAPDDSVRHQQLLLLGGFGAIFSLFILKLLCDFLPISKRPSPAEYTFVFAMLVVGIPAAAMGRIALESAVCNHFVGRVESGERGMIPDFWAPNPHIGYVPLLDTPDARCPYVELPDDEDGNPRREALPPPPLAESLERAQAAAVRSEKALADTRLAAQPLERKKDVLDCIETVKNAAATAANAAAQIMDMDTDDPAQAAYLAWAGDEAADASMRGPVCVVNADVISKFRKGKTSVPWGFWLLPMLYWFVVMAVFNMTIILGLMLLRKSWVDKERLPFPYARVAQGIIFPSRDKPKDSRHQVSFPRTIAYVAFILGLLFCVRGMVTISETSGGGDMPPVKTLLELDLTWLNLIPGVKMILVIMPFALLFILFFPIDLLFTVVIANLIGEFVYPWIMQLWGAKTNVRLPYDILRMGGILGVSLFLLIFHRKDLWKVVTGLWDKAKGREGDDPLTPRELSVGFLLVFGIFCVTVIAGEGANTGESIFMRALVFVYALAMIYMYNIHHIRMRASGAFQYFDFNNILHTGGWFNWHGFGMQHSVPMAQGSNIMMPDKALNFHTLYQLEMFGAYSKSMGPASQVLEAFSLADATRARNRDILKGVMIGLLVSILLVMPFYLIAVHSKGYDNTPTANKEWNDHFIVTDKAYRYHTKYNPGIFTYRSYWWVILGAGIYGLCMYLRREHARFPIEPMGLLIAGTYGGRCGMGIDRIWFTFILALLAKYVIFRWYGVRAFQEKVAPFIVYCLMGMCLGTVLFLFLSAILVSRGMML